MFGQATRRVEERRHYAHQRASVEGMFKEAHKRRRLEETACRSRFDRTQTVLAAVFGGGQVCFGISTPIEDKIGATGFEPATTCTPYKCATKLRYAPVFYTALPGTFHKSHEKITKVQ